jgi:hypothetical protein
MGRDVVPRYQRRSVGARVVDDQHVGLVPELQLDVPARIIDRGKRGGKRTPLIECGHDNRELQHADVATGASPLVASRHTPNGTSGRAASTRCRFGPMQRSPPRRLRTPAWDELRSSDDTRSDPVPLPHS